MLTCNMADGEQTLLEVLKKIASERNYNDCSITIKPISSEGANYTSQLYTATITGDKKDHTTKDLHVFAKVATIPEAMLKAIGVHIFDTEHLFYTKIMNRYRQIEDQYGLTEDQRLSVPEFLYYDPTDMKETLVLENLVAKGYGSYDRFSSINWEYASAAVTELAKYHALAFAFNLLYPEDYQEVNSKIARDLSPDMFDDFFYGPIEQAMKAVNPEHKEKLERFVNTYMKSKPFEKLYEPITTSVICHIDYRPSNLLHRTREDGKVDIKIVDHQTIHEACPVADLLYFIFTGSDEEFRAQHYEQLVEHYYSQLTDAMLRLHLDPEQYYSRDVFNHELEMKLPYGLAIAVMGLPIVTVEPENAPVMGDDVSSFAVTKTGDVYPERLNGVINDYVKWGILQ